MKDCFTLAFGIGLVASAVSAVEFESDILPIFSAKCAKCHMDGSSKGGVALDLDRIDREIGSGKAISPGDTEGSELFEVVTLPDDDGDKMPPEGKGRPLSTAEVAKLKAWIEAGASLGDASEAEMAEATDEKPARPDPIDGNWTNAQGKVITATLMRVEGNLAVLRMNGKEFDYPIESLSAESQAIVKQFAADWEAASGF